jgi:hypothetical protein
MHFFPRFVPGTWLLVPLLVKHGLCGRLSGSPREASSSANSEVDSDAQQFALHGTVPSIHILLLEWGDFLILPSADMPISAGWRGNT